MNITIEMIKQLRDDTGAGVMACRKALEESALNLNQARDLLRQAAELQLKKRADHEALQGRIELYSHMDGRIGVMVEINTETEFASRSEIFRRFAREIALQITSECPLFVNEENIPHSVLDELACAAAEKARAAGKPERIIERIVAGVLEKYKDRHVLLRQAYLRDETISVAQLLNQTASQIGEKIVVRRFQRWEINPDLT
ncbi:MAG TPA: elongation factor Ts [Anaerolineaceae bacterium]|nr:elongation factor Ts [Anaerolineaceae bacterium]